jgi:hypothetical protein
MARSVIGKFSTGLDKHRRLIAAKLKLVDEELEHADLEMQKTRDEQLANLSKGTSDATDLMMAPRMANSCEIPFGDNPSFVGRETELDNIHDILFRKSPTLGMLTACQPRSVVIHGMGGMGKSEIALKYAHRHRADYQCIFWLDAETRDALFASCVNVAASTNLLRLPSHVNWVEETHKVPETKLRNDLHDWLKNTETRWLMILDNAPDHSFVGDYWPRGNGGSVLVTTRSPSFWRRLGSPSFALGPIDDASATDILLASTSRSSLPPGNLEQAVEVCHRLGNWPLALSQISGYMSETGCSLSRFLETYDDYDSHQAVHSSSIAESTTRYDKTITTVFSLSANFLEKTCKESLHTLFLMTFLNRDGRSIPLSPFFPKLSQSPWYADTKSILDRNSS